MFRTESFPYACVPLVEREREREREEKHRSNELWRESSRENSSAFRSFDSENGKEAERVLDKLLRIVFVSPNFPNRRSSRNIFEFANARVDSRRVILESSRLVIVEFVIPFTTSAPRRPYESIMPIELSNRRWETGTGSRGVVPRCVNPTRWFLFFFFVSRGAGSGVKYSNLRVGSRPARRAIHILFLRGRETIVLRAIESGLDRDTLGYFFELSFFCSGKIEFATKNTLINELTFSSCSSRWREIS